MHSSVSERREARAEFPMKRQLSRLVAANPYPIPSYSRYHRSIVFRCPVWLNRARAKLEQFDSPRFQRRAMRLGVEVFNGDIQSSLRWQQTFSIRAECLGELSCSRGRSRERLRFTCRRWHAKRKRDPFVDSRQLCDTVCA